MGSNYIIYNQILAHIKYRKFQVGIWIMSFLIEITDNIPSLLQLISKQVECVE